MFFNQPAIIPAFLNPTNNESFIFSQKNENERQAESLKFWEYVKTRHDHGMYSWLSQHSAFIVSRHDDLMTHSCQVMSALLYRRWKACRLFTCSIRTQTYNFSTKNLRILIQKREEGLRQTLLDKESWNDDHKRVQNHAADQLRRIPSRAALLCRREFQGNSTSL